MGVYLLSPCETEVEILCMANLQGLAEAIRAELADACPMPIGVAEEQADDGCIGPQLSPTWRDLYDLSETCS